MGCTVSASKSEGSKLRWTQRELRAITERAARSKVLSLEGPPRLKPELLVQEVSRADLGGLRLVNLKSLGLVDFPQQLVVNSFATLRTLKLAHNVLRSIPPFFAQLQSLTTLELSFNSIETVDFQNVPFSLETLSLDHNEIQCLVPGPLRHLKMLTALDLSGNKGIASIDPLNWDELVSLEELRLDDLSLKCLPSQLSRCRRLIVISARNNNISPDEQGVPAQLLEASPLLHTLQLQGNPQMDEAKFLALPGVGEYLDRRRAKVDKQLAGGTFDPSLVLI